MASANDQTPLAGHAGQQNGDPQRTRARRLCISFIAWLVSLLGAIAPGIFPIALDFTTRAGGFLPPGITPLMLRWVGWTAGPILGAGLGAAVGWAYSNRVERCVRAIILGGAGAVIISAAAGWIIRWIGQRDYLDAAAIQLAQLRLVMGLLPLGMVAGLTFIGWGRRFRLGSLFGATSVVALLLVWALAPLRAPAFVIAADPAFRAIRARVETDHSLQPILPADFTKVSLPTPYMSLHLTPRLRANGNELGAASLVIGLGRYAADRLAGTSEEARLETAVFSRKSVWRVDGSEVGLSLRTKSADPDAHARLKRIIEEEFRRRGMMLTPI